MPNKTEEKIAYMNYIEKMGFYVDVNRYEALAGICLSEDELIDDVYKVSIELVQNKGISIRQACEYLYEIGKLNKR